MNFGAISAMVLATGVLIYGLILSAGGGDLKMFYDFPSVFIVFGGVIAATAMSFQYRRMFAMMKFGFMRVVKGKEMDYKALIKDIIHTIESYRKGESLKTIAEGTKDNFFKEGIEMLDGGIMTTEQVLNLMEERNANLFHLYSEDAGKLKVVGKYPPAFGMMGTTMGMIVLLGNLSGADAIKRVGPAMAVCLITTLYGTIMSNLGFLPLADNLVEQSKETFLKNKIIIEGLKLLSAKENPIYAAEVLNSFLLPGDRLDWKAVLQGGK